MKGWAPHLRGHLLLFEAKPPASYGSSIGWRLLLIVLFLEGVAGRRLSALSLSGLPMPPAWLHVPLLLGLALLAVRFVGGLRLSQLGLYPWREWSLTEKSYFLQVVVLANGIFGLLLAGRLQQILAEPSLRGRAAVVLATYVLWGFYQELVYRGMLQTELVRRWGSAVGILVSNSLFTFGPLHLYHWSSPSASRSLVMFGAIFAIGLFFAVLFRRSGNLWMVGVFHGIGDAYLTGLGTLAN